MVFEIIASVIDLVLEVCAPVLIPIAYVTQTA
jgi:hypothetical protein